METYITQHTLARLESLVSILECQLHRLEKRLYHLERTKDKWHAAFAVFLGLGSIVLSIFPYLMKGA